jgi:hypothetical protein
MMTTIRKSWTLGIVLLVTLAGAVRADWNPGDPAKWVQLPDLSQNGMDVYDTRWPQTNPTSTTFKLLADDWLCTTVEPVTDIHIWGSWLNNILPFGDGVPFAGNPAAVTFKLSIHEDVPAGVDAEWSHPGPQVWSAMVPATSVRRYAPSAQFPTTILEQFYDPNINQIIGTDNEVWQYNFTNLPNPFIQQGTTAEPKIYWLDVQAFTEDTQAIFGWKTSFQHFNDDAAFADTQGFGGPLLPNPNNPGGLPWTEMRYPPGHPLAGQSIDLSFVITTIPEPATMSLLLIAFAALIPARRR